MPDWRQEIARRLRPLGLAPTRELEIVEELGQHLEDRYQELRTRGAGEEESRRAALEDLCGEDLLARSLRPLEHKCDPEPVVPGGGGGRGLLTSLYQDIRFALRMFRKNPGFTAVAIITLAIGIGANTAIFSLGNVFLFRPLPVRDADRLTVVAVQYHADAEPSQLSYPDFKDYRAQADVFTDMTFYSLTMSGLGYMGHADRIVMAYVPSNFFAMLGIRPALGRLIVPGEGDEPKTGPVVVLGHSYWMRRFGGDPGVIGRGVTLDGKSLMVIGVVPEEFRGPYGILELEAYAPIGMYGAGTGDSGLYTDRRDTELRVLATLKPGVTVKQAEASLNVIARRLASEYPEADYGQIARVIPERLARPEPGVAAYMPLVTAVFFVMVGLVLLVACFNVANLLLARAGAREREIAVRSALGAGRACLIRQLLTENILLAAAGAAGGALAGNWAIRGLERLRPLGDFALRLAFEFDWRVFSYVTAIALGAGIVSGLAPALRISATNLTDSLREAGRGTVGGGRHLLRNAFVVAQVAGSLIVLVAACLFIRSLTNARSIDLGFNPRNTLNVSLNPKLQGYDKPRAEAFFRELLSRAKSLPGVEAASFSFSVPLGYYGDGTTVFAEGQPRQSNGKRDLSAGYNCVTPDYFSTMRMKILSGRSFLEADTNASRRVAVVNEAMAERLWPRQDPLGRRFSYEGAEGPFKSANPDPSGTLVTVVGVVRNARLQSLLDPPGCFFYVPLSQNYKSVQVLQLRTAVPPESLITPVETLVRGLDPNLPMFDVMSMERAMAGANGYFLFEMGAGFASLLGSLSLFLAMIGVYAVVSFAAAARKHEIGIRMALGAKPRSVVGMVVGQALALVGVGIAIGLSAALLVSRVLESLLVGVRSYDYLTYTAVPALMLAVAFVACYIPARRAVSVDPIAALRTE